MDENRKREEFAQCWLKAEPSISAYVFAAVAGFHDAEDVVQRIAQELARRFDEYDSDRPFIGWALWIAKSRVIDFYRKQSRNQLVFSNDLLQRLGETIAEQAENRDRRRLAGTQRVEVVGSDPTGAMYGGLEIADRLRLGFPIENLKRTPFIKKRGIKFNIPLDARTPSYDDTGDAAQKNIETMWDFEFWKAYLDDLARYRYNVLSLWTTHPFPSIIKLEKYPEVALDDVYRLGITASKNLVIYNESEGKKRIRWKSPSAN
jgi:RNA polymerase sigma factor (sigma-70 family)